MKELRLDHHDSDARLELPQFLDFLRESPLLESIILVYAGLVEEDEEEEAVTLVTLKQYDRSLNLPNLRYLEIAERETSKFPLDFLRCITFPPCATRSFWGGVGEIYDFDIPELFFPHKETEDFVFENTTTPVISSVAGNLVKPFACYKDMKLYCHLDPLPILKQVDIFSLSRNFERVREVTWVPQPDWEPLETSLLPYLPELRVLRLSGHVFEGINELFDALIERVEDGGEFEHAPLLEELHIYYIDGECGPESEPWESMGSIYDFLDDRSNSDSPFLGLLVGGFPLDVVEDWRDHFDTIDIDDNYVVWSPLKKIWDHERRSCNWDFML